MSRPSPSEYAAYYDTYVRLVPEADILPALESQLDEYLRLLRPLSEEVGDTVHSPYTWSVKQVVGHLIDGERVFAYRALCISRGERQPLPGFDENEYAATANWNAQTLQRLVDEFELCRRSNVLMFRQMPAEAWDRVGTASDNPVTVRALAYMLVGHVRHHGAILKKRLQLN